MEADSSAEGRPIARLAARGWGTHPSRQAAEPSSKAAGLMRQQQGSDAAAQRLEREPDLRRRPVARGR